MIFRSFFLTGILSVVACLATSVALADQPMTRGANWVLNNNGSQYSLFRLDNTIQKNGQANACLAQGWDTNDLPRTIAASSQASVNLEYIVPKDPDYDPCGGRNALAEADYQVITPDGDPNQCPEILHFALHIVSADDLLEPNPDSYLEVTKKEGNDCVTLESNGSKSTSDIKIPWVWNQHGDMNLTFSN